MTLPPVSHWTNQSSSTVTRRLARLRLPYRAYVRALAFELVGYSEIPLVVVR